MNEMEDFTGTLLVTRPTVAMHLAQMGHKYQLIPHPWKTGLNAWVFDLDDLTVADAVIIYTEMGLRIPEPLTHAIHRMRMRGMEEETAGGFDSSAGGAE